MSVSFNPFLAETVFIIVIFIIGSFIGQYLANMVVSKTTKRNQKKRCSRCRKRLSLAERIPFSYFFLKGRCKHCHEKIPVIYPFFEVVGAILPLLILFIYNFELNAVIVYLFIMFSLALGFINQRVKKVPKRVFFGLYLLSFVSIYLNHFSLRQSLIGFAAALGLVLIICILLDLSKERLDILLYSGSVGLMLGAKETVVFLILFLFLNLFNFLLQHFTQKKIDLILLLVISLIITLLIGQVLVIYFENFIHFLLS